VSVLRVSFFSFAFVLLFDRNFTINVDIELTQLLYDTHRGQAHRSHRGYPHRLPHAQVVDHLMAASSHLRRGRFGSARHEPSLLGFPAR
jgi:hypothetical protein